MSGERLVEARRLKTFTVSFERDEEDWWVASVREVPGCHTQGRSLRETRVRIREALSLFVRGAARARLIEELNLPTQAKRVVARLHQARERADRQVGLARSATRDAARVLTKDLRLSVRDAGELLGLSHQRVQQLLSSPSRRSAA